jgi:hypothetical protein
MHAITLVFPPPQGQTIGGQNVNLAPAQMGIIPQIGDSVIVAGVARKVTEKFFTFYDDQVIINFAVE